MSDEPGEPADSDRLFPGAAPLFLGQQEEEAGLDEAEPAEPVGLPSARDLKPGEFHRPPPTITSLPTAAAYQPAAIEPPAPEPTTERVGLPSARDLKPGEFHRPPPTIVSLPTAPAYQPAGVGPVERSEPPIRRPVASPVDPSERPLLPDPPDPPTDPEPPTLEDSDDRAPDGDQSRREDDPRPGRAGVLAGAAAGLLVLIGGTIAAVGLLGAKDDSGTDHAAALLATDSDGTLGAPYGTGDWTPVGSEWWVSVTNADIDAAPVLMDSADFNPAPDNGGYVLADLEIRYVGTDPTTLFDLDIDAMAPSGRIHSAFDCRATEPRPIDRRIDVFSGAVIAGQECFDVAAADQAGLVLSISATDSAEPVHIALNAVGSSDQSPPPEPLPTPAADDSPGSRAAPIPIGRPVDIGTGWTLTIDGVRRDAERELIGTNPFNEPPNNGRYVLAQVTAVYDGGGQTDGLDLRLNAVGPRNVGYSSAGCAAVEPDPFPWSTTISGSGTLSGQVCFDLDAADVDDLAIYARSGLDTPPTFFATKRTRTD